MKLHWSGSRFRGLTEQRPLHRLNLSMLCERGVRVSVAPGRRWRRPSLSERECGPHSAVNSLRLRAARMRSAQLRVGVYALKRCNCIATMRRCDVAMLRNGGFALWHAGCLLGLRRETAVRGDGSTLAHRTLRKARHDSALTVGRRRSQPFQGRRSDVIRSTLDLC